MARALRVGGNKSDIVEPMQMVHAGEHVEFRILNRFPLFREVYGANGLGTIEVTGTIRQQAKISVEDGSVYRLRATSRLAGRDGSHFSYAIRNQDGSANYRLITPLRSANDAGAAQPETYRIVLEETEYAFRQKTPGRRGFSIVDGSEQNTLVSTDGSNGIAVHYTVPALLVLLLPWVDNQVRLP